MFFLFESFEMKNEISWSLIYLHLFFSNHKILASRTVPFISFLQNLCQSKVFQALAKSKSCSWVEFRVMTVFLVLPENIKTHLLFALYPDLKLDFVLTLIYSFKDFCIFEYFLFVFKRNHVWIHSHSAITGENSKVFFLFYASFHVFDICNWNPFGCNELCNSIIEMTSQ